MRYYWYLVYRGRDATWTSSFNILLVLWRVSFRIQKINVYHSSPQTQKHELTHLQIPFSRTTTVDATGPKQRPNAFKCVQLNNGCTLQFSKPRITLHNPRPQTSTDPDKAQAWFAGGTRSQPWHWWRSSPEIFKFMFSWVSSLLCRSALWDNWR